MLFVNFRSAKSHGTVEQIRTIEANEIHQKTFCNKLEIADQ